MKAMIFAAGMGTRLKPLTDRMPKALVQVGGKPLIEHISRKIKDSGFESAVVNVHHFADMLQSWLQSQDWFDFQVSDERKMLLETGGAILHARPYLDGCSDFLVHNVDILTNADLKWFADQHRKDSLATLLVSPRKTSRYFLFHPESMRLVGWTNIPSGETILTDSSLQKEDCLMFAFSGIHIMSEKIFDIMENYVNETGIPSNGDAGVRFSIKDFYMYAASSYPIYGVNLPDFRMMDVGKLDTLSQAEEFLSTL